WYVAGGGDFSDHAGPVFTGTGAGGFTDTGCSGPGAARCPLAHSGYLESTAVVVIASGLLVRAAGPVVAGAALSGFTHNLQYGSACADGRCHWRPDSGHDCPRVAGAFRSPAGTPANEVGRVCTAAGRGPVAVCG